MKAEPDTVQLDIYKYTGTLLNESTGIGGAYLYDWGLSLTLITISKSGRSSIISRRKCSTPLHL